MMTIYTIHWKELDESTGDILGCGVEDSFTSLEQAKKTVTGLMLVDLAPDTDPIGGRRIWIPTTPLNRTYYITETELIEPEP